MAYEIKLTLDGEERNVLHFFTEYFRLNSSDPILMSSFPTLDDCNRNLPYYRFDPSGPPLDGRFHVTMESTGDDDLFYANLKTGKFMHGIFRFYRTLDEGIPFRTIEFWDTFVSETSEQMSSNGMPMLLHVVLSPATVRFNKGLVFQKNWFVTDIHVKPITVQDEEEDPEKKITKLYWIDVETKEEIETIASNQKALLCFETQGYKKGETVKAKVKRNDGGKFANNSTELTFSGIVDENGNATSKEIYELNENNN